jgi:hypothetical protein
MCNLRIRVGSATDMALTLPYQGLIAVANHGNRPTAPSLAAHWRCQANVRAPVDGSILVDRELVSDIAQELHQFMLIDAGVLRSGLLRVTSLCYE